MGDAVSVLIPRIDRGGSDLPRIPGIIVRKSHEHYEIITQYGVLNDCLLASELEDYNGLINFDPKAITNKISLREAARLAGNREKDLRLIELKCNCNGKCVNEFSIQINSLYTFFINKL